MVEHKLETSDEMVDHANELLEELLEVYDAAFDPAAYIVAAVGAMVLKGAGVTKIELEVPGVGMMTLSLAEPAIPAGEVIH